MVVNRQNPRRAFGRCSRIAYNRTYDEFRRAKETAVVVTNVRHSAKVRLYDSEDRVCGYALTNAAGRGVSVSLAYDGSYVTNTVYTMPNGSRFAARLSREAGRRNLVTRRDYFFGGQSIYWYSTEYDLLNRPTNATDSVSLAREWLYNRRSELAAASVGTNLYGYAYDTIGNRLWSAANAVTNSYSANNLNQYASISPGTNFVYDADGNMTSDGTFSYSFDAENRLLAAYPLSPAVGSLAVENRYDHRHRRTRKIVKQYDGADWETKETHTFVWDGNNILLELVEFANGASRTFEYFWGADKSGSAQGAGGVEGLLAVSMDGVFYVPCYDHNGNIVLYVSESGAIDAQSVYDPYGNVVETYGNLADAFSFGFSTKYHDRETGMVGYQRRFYRPDLGRWLNRDPIEEEGGENLYAFCNNSPVLCYDVNGCWAFIDNAIAAIGGAVVGIACQAISDVIRGEASGWESYVGSAVAGAITGEILLHNPAMAGATKALYAGMAAAVGNGVKQLCEVKVTKKKENYDAQEMAVDFAAGATFAMLPFKKINGINKGSGSYLSIARSMNKKFINGSISRVSTATTLKSLAGTSIGYGVPYGLIQPYVSDKVNQGINYLSDMMTPADDGVQAFYHEELIICVTDKCGNVVILHYTREIQINE